MIPLAYLALARRFWWLLPVTALAIMAATFRIQRDSAREDVERLEAAVAAQEATYRARVAAVAAANTEAQRGYAEELERIRRDRPVPRVVRLCVEPTAPVPGVPTLAGGTGDPGLAGGFGPRVPGGDSAGPDVWPGLQRLAEGYDVRNAQVRGLLKRQRQLEEMTATRETK